MRRRCLGLVVFAVLCAPTLLGCSESARIVEGQITLEGKPLESGAIAFEPTDQRGTPFGGDIQDGRYRIEVAPQQAVGTTTVRINSPQPTGRKIPAGSPAPAGYMVDEIRDVVPPKYNTSSTLRVDLSSGGPHNFELLAAPQ